MLQALPKTTATTNKGVIHEKHLHPSINQHLSRFETGPTTCPIGDGLAKDIIISDTESRVRGSPSPAVRAGGNLVGRGIANPMSERTRGFEILSSLRRFGLPEKEDRTKFPLPALLLL